MTRRTAELRHRDSRPAHTPGAESGTELLDALIAFHHPTRRWLCEVLSSEGPANVGTLAARTGLAVGSSPRPTSPGTLARAGGGSPPGT